MKGRLEGQVAIVTGAAGGLGLGAVERLAEEGADVVLADVKPSVEEMWTRLQKDFPDNRGYSTVVDVTSASAVNEMVVQAVERLDRLDVILNNAGTAQKVCPIADTPDELFDSVIDINLRGVFNGCRAAARVMRDQRGGSIVNIGSWYGQQGHANTSVYCASKAGVIRMTECLAMEMAPYGVRANCICPGNMATDLHWMPLREEAKMQGITFEEADRLMKESIPLGRQGTAREIGDAVVFLASAESSYITGASLNVNGGVLLG
jgi:NAD(P)-dependent dehydrogenase (short-subunit alcohol dehydrogenase family)